MRRHQPMVYHLALSLVRNESDARDIVQEAFLRVYRSLDAFEGDSAFHTWLYRIVHNLAIDLLRKPHRGRIVFEQFETFGTMSAASTVNGPSVRLPDDEVWRKELAARVRLALESLSNTHREVIVLRELRGMSYGEMAAHMGCAKGTIMSRLFHARRRLKHSLQALYDETFDIEGAWKSRDCHGKAAVTRE
ncbi:MAG: sigma-70 family RNA polymerase sigma factor [Polyangiaceae bacterium]